MKEEKKIVDPQKIKIFYFLIFINLLICTSEFISIASIYPLLFVLTQETLPSIVVDIVNFLKIKESNTLTFFIIVLVVFLLLKNVLAIFANYIVQDFLFKNYNYLANSVIMGMLSRSYLEIINLSSPIFIRNCKEIIFSSRNYLMCKIFLYSEIILVFSIVIFLLIMSFKITLVSFLILIIFSFILNNYLKKKTSNLGEKRNKSYANINNILIEIFNSFREIKIYSKSNFYLNNYRDQQYEFSETQKKLDFFTSVTRYLFEIIIVFFLCLIYFLNINIINIALIPTLGFFAFSFFRLYPSFTKISVLITHLRSNKNSISILEDIHKKISHEEILNKNNIKFESTIELKDISFGYNNRELLLKNIKLVISKGKKIGITGENGSGKTTLCNIILSLIKPEVGEILIDNRVNVFDNLYGYRNLISFIPQNIFLLNDTVEKNITFNHDNFDIEKLKKVLVVTQLEKLIFDLKKNRKIVIGENGNNLSGGQRQKIAIARALYNDTEIVVMDEHTSSLDLKMQKEFLASSKEIFNTKTLIIVSHNKEMLDFCDEVYILKNGQLSKI